MSFEIFCTDPQYPFSFMVKSLEEENLETEEVTSCLEEWISEIILEIEPEAKGFFPEEWRYDCPLYIKARSKVAKFLKENIVIKDTDKDNAIVSDIVDLTAVTNDIFDFKEGTEQGYVDVGGYAIYCLERFLEEGQWQYAMRDSSGKYYGEISDWKLNEKENKLEWQCDAEIVQPCIWFGLKGQNPLDCWTITKSEKLFEYANSYQKKEKIPNWKYFWFNEQNIFDWNMLMDRQEDLSNSYTTWMFAECGMSEPNNEDLLASCPIKLDSNDSKEELYAKIDQFFLEKYNSVHK